MGKFVDVEISKTKMPLARKEMPFRVAIADKLDNGYEVKDLTERGIKELHDILRDTVYKKVTITEAEQSFRRRGEETSCDEDGKKTIIHFGKAKKPFRMFGYYNQDGYFIITRLDPTHDTHRM